MMNTLLQCDGAMRAMTWFHTVNGRWHPAQEMNPKLSATNAMVQGDIECDDAMR